MIINNTTINTKKIKIYVFATMHNIKCVEWIVNYFKEEYEITYVLPSECCNKFSDIARNNCNIVDENLILSKHEFKELLSQTVISDNCRELINQRFGWYYQQCLKLVLACTCNQKKLIIWDGDTIPLNKITFFSENKQNIFISPYEFHKEYFKTNKFLLGKSYRNINYSQIVQFSSITKENIYFLKNLLDLDSSHILMVKKNLLTKIFHAIDQSIENKSISLFSEYELLGNIKLMSSKSILKIPLLFFRDSITVYSEKKIKLLKSLNFKMITFENNKNDEKSQNLNLKFYFHIVKFYYKYALLIIFNKFQSFIKFIKFITKI
jgi:hypothetical protein